jgi:hypothetical protein
MKHFFTLLFLLSMTLVYSQVTFNKDIAPIIYNHCTSCHRPGEIGPMNLTSYEEVVNWASMIRFVTSSRIMPPWKADPTYRHFLDENYLSDAQISSIQSWVDNGTPEGNASDVTPLPNFPEGSLLGQPDLKLSFARSFTHKGSGLDEYRYFVLPTGLTTNKKLKAIEMRPGNTKVVHHALFFADKSGKAKAYDEQTPEYGFSADDFADFDAFEVINRDQFPGYVPGQKSRYFPDGLAQNLDANSDLIIQMHYAPTPVDEVDSSSVNLFFADDTEVIDRIVKQYIMLPTNIPGGFTAFRMPANQVKTFEGSYTLPFDVSLVGIFPHMHLLGQNWEVWVENADGSKTNLIKIPEWDFNWQGGYNFDRFIVAKKGAKVKARATYDNTSNNPSNPNSPPKIVGWGERTSDEMFYLPLLYVPYKSGDENVIFGGQPSSSLDFTQPLQVSLQPNPADKNAWVDINFSIENGGPVSISILDGSGKVIRQLRQNEYFGSGNHTIKWMPSNVPSGNYYVAIVHANKMSSLPVVVK